MLRSSAENERHDFTKARELHDRINDQLTGPVIGCVTASLDFDDVDAERGERRRPETQTRRLRVTAEGENRIVLDHDPGVGVGTGCDAGVHVAH